MRIFYVDSAYSSCFSCSKELGQWDLLMEFGKTKGHANPFLGKFIGQLLHLLFILLMIAFVTCISFHRSRLLSADSDKLIESNLFFEHVLF